MKVKALGFWIAVLSGSLAIVPPGGAAPAATKPPAAEKAPPTASLAGHIVDDRGDPVAAEVEVFPSTNQDPHSADPLASKRSRQKALKARANEKGFFQILGIAPGHVDLRAEAPGLVPAVLAREIELVAGDEIVLPQALVLRPPVRLKIALLPEWDPWGQPWEVDLFLPGAGQEPQRSKAAGDGSWSSAALEPGKYWLRIWGRDDRLWETREIELVAEADPLTVLIPVLEVRGKVTVGEEPFAGTLELGQRASNSGIRFPLDENGKFAGYLPREGRWLVSLERADGGRQSSILATEIKKAKGKSYAVVELEIPNTRISGDVVDAEGKKVAEADVSYFSFEVQSMASVKTDAEGGFEIFGIAPGNVTLTARKEGRQSLGVIVRVAEDEPGEDHRLVLHENAKIDGRVTFSGLPQEGIRIVAWPEFGLSSTNSVLRQSSGADGAFQLEVPGYVAQLLVLAEGRGGRRRLLRHAVRGGEPLVVEMDVDRGQLTVDLSEWLAGRGPQALLEVSLLHDGIQLPQLLWRLLGLAEEGEAGVFRLGQFETGQYALCIGRNSPGGPPPRCRDGYLATGGTLTLKAPESAGEKAPPAR